MAPNSSVEQEYHMTKKEKIMILKKEKWPCLQKLKVSNGQRWFLFGHSGPQSQENFYWTGHVFFLKMQRMILCIYCRIFTPILWLLAHVILSKKNCFTVINVWQIKCTKVWKPVLFMSHMGKLITGGRPGKNHNGLRQIGLLVLLLGVG